MCHMSQLARSAVELQLQCNGQSRALLPLINAAQALCTFPLLSDNSQSDSAALSFRLLPPPIANSASQASSVDEQLYSNLHESQKSAPQCQGIATPSSSNDTQASCHAISASWQLLPWTPHHRWSQPSMGLHLLPQRPAHGAHTITTMLARHFHSTASYGQHQNFGHDSSHQHGTNRPPPSARPGFSRQQPPPSSNSAPRFAEDQRRPPAYGSSQQPAQSGSQRAPLQQPPSQGSWTPGSSIPQQSWGPTYKYARRNPRAPPAEAPQVKRLKANQEITAPEVRLVGTDGTHQVMPLAEALQAARNAKLDLVQVAGAAAPPVCRLLNHSQVSYEAKVKERKAEKKQHENRKLATIKEVHFGAHTAEHDMQVKVKKAKEFLEKGHKVKCTLKHKPVRGQGQKDALKALPVLKERMAEFAEVSAPPPMERQTPNSLSFYLAPLLEQKQA